MIDLQYEGAIEDISENQFKFIGEILKKKKLSDKKVLIEVVGAAGDNYMANVKRIITKDAEGNLFKMVAKIAPKLIQIRNAFNTHRVFKNEHIMYTEVLPKFKEMQESANVPKTDLLTFAECYGSYIEEPDEIILLEDLKEKNCVMLDRLKPLDECFLLPILKKLAILHSLSFVLKQNHPEIFNEISQRLYGFWTNMGNNEQAKTGFIKMEDHLLTLLSDSENKSDIVRGIIRNLSSNLAELSKEDAGTKYTVIQHGDAWTNNFMFILNDGMLMETIIIDYQVSSETNPVCDILFLILNCTDHQTRIKRFKDWIDHYHTELDKALSFFGLKAKEVYPREQLDVDLKKYGKAMCGLCIFFSNILSMDSEDAAKVKESFNDDMDIEAHFEQNNVAAFKTRVEGIIDSCITFGLV